MESAKDLMQKSAVAHARPVDLFMKREYARKKYAGTTRFEYCPKCYTQMKRAGLDFKKELQPLWVYTFKCLYKVDEASGFIDYEKFYKCERCMKDGSLISEDELIQGWIDPGNRKKNYTKLVDLNDKKALEMF